MTPETINANSETLFDSFYDGLRLLRDKERKYSCAFLGIDPEKLSDIDKSFTPESLGTIIGKLRELYYGQNGLPEKYEAIINKAVAPYLEAEPAKYTALQDPELLDLSKQMVRMGILHEFTQHWINKSRIAKHQRNGQHNGTGRPVAKTDDLIIFNHHVRDLIESQAGKKMQLDRSKMRKILRVTMLGDAEHADSVEQGIAIEIATRRFMVKTLGASAVAFGTVKQDKDRGDIILFPQAGHEVFLDVKKTPPDKIRRSLSHDEIKVPGLVWENPTTACLWLGTETNIGNNYDLPPEAVQIAQILAKDAQPAVA